MENKSNSTIWTTIETRICSISVEPFAQLRTNIKTPQCMAPPCVRIGKANSSYYTLFLYYYVVDVMSTYVRLYVCSTSSSVLFICIYMPTCMHACICMSLWRRWMDRWTDEHGRTNGWIDGWMVDGWMHYTDWMDVGMDELVDEWINEWMIRMTGWMTIVNK